MRPKYEPEQIREVQQAIEHLRRPDALIHERKVAGMLEQLLRENQWLEKQFADASRIINQNWYKHHLKPVADPNRPTPRYPPGGRP